MNDSSAYQVIRSILDLLFPPSDRVQIVRQLSAKDLERLPTERVPKKGFIKAVCDYRSPQVRQVVQAGKYDGSYDATRLMGAVIQEILLGICEEERVFANKIVMTPIPLSTVRRQERGFNQSERIARAIASRDESGTFQVQRLLEKTRDTQPQTQLSKKQRQKNVREVFQARNANQLPEDIIIVIDDVTTTGATLMEARRALQAETPARVIGVAFAH